MVQLVEALRFKLEGCNQVPNITYHIIPYHIISYIIYFHSVDLYRITKSVWIWKSSNLLRKSRSEVNIKYTIILVTRSSTILEVLT